MIQSLFVVQSVSGEIVLEKHWRAITSRDVCDIFISEVKKQKNIEDVCPIISTPSAYIVNILRDGLFYVAVLTAESPPLLVIEFLQRFHDILGQYLQKITINAIRKNFSMVYQLLEEMCDNGHPFTTFVNPLMDLIPPPSLMGGVIQKISGKSGMKESLARGVVPWRKAVVKHSINQIMFDVIEKLHCIIDADGRDVMNVVSGDIMCNSNMSGFPDIQVIFSNSQAFEDVELHPCVRLRKFESDRCLSFVPPDGEFKLMSYRVSKVSPRVPFFITPNIIRKDGAWTIKLNVGSRPMQGMKLIAKTMKKEANINDLEITFKCPTFIESVIEHEASEGAFEAIKHEDHFLCKWRIGKLGTKSPQLSVNTKLKADSVNDEAITFGVDFKLPYTNVSGVTLADLQLKSETYNFKHGARYGAVSGNYEIRS